MKKYSFAPQGVCCKQIAFELEDGVIRSVVFHGGCDGNLKGISRLVAGQSAESVSKMLHGVDCRGRGTSCPDQFATALEAALAAK